MAETEVGNIHGVAAVGGDRYLAAVTADGINTVTVDSIEELEVNMQVDIVHTDGTVLASDRNIDVINTDGTVTYSGADVAATTAHRLVKAGQQGVPRSNINGGQSIRSGFFDPDMATIESLRQRLKDIDGTVYTDARLNTMTKNDMVYAVRMLDHAGSVK